ncbi:MAG: VanW family protein [Solibacillus sp.]
MGGCQEKASSLADLDQESPLDVVLENDVDQEEENEQQIQPVRVTITDPRTLELVTSITPQDLAYETDFDLYQEKIQELAKQLARGTDTSSGYDQTMVLDKIGDDGQIIKGNPRVILKESELVEKILAASKDGGNVDLPLYVTESNYKSEDIPFLDEVTIASFTTYFKASDIGRSKNIELSANALDHILVGDGDYFSFNTMVGERTEERGYQPALEIINQEYVMGIGGGICQTSSTLFNAVDQLGVKMTERHHHSLSIGYVPAGRDATVSYGTLDFKFQNSSGAPFLIRTMYLDGVLTVEIRTAQKYEAMFNEG